jgi:hypothetical protein
MKPLIALVVLAGSAVAAPPPTQPPPSLPIVELVLEAADVSTFVAGPQHARVRRVTVDGCGTVADLVPLRALPAGIDVQLGKSNCLSVDKLDGIERARSLMSFAKVRDISALANATQLRDLSLNNGPLPIADLAALTLPALRSLNVNLHHHPEADAELLFESPLVANLEELSFGVEFIPSLPALPKLRTLTASLYPHDTRRGDLSFVRKAPALKHLRVGGLETADLAPILALRDLETLDIAGLCRVDARRLARLPKLRWVTISKQVEEARKPVRTGLEVTPSNPYALCSPKP